MLEVSAPHSHSTLYGAHPLYMRRRHCRTLAAFVTLELTCRCPLCIRVAVILYLSFYILACVLQIWKCKE